MRRIGSIFLLPGFFAIGLLVQQGCRSGGLKSDGNRNEITAQLNSEDSIWWGWNQYQIPDYTDQGKLASYGYELIANTSYYLGPKGKVAAITNGMNCQNCHLSGGTVPFGNNFGKVYATYPLYRARNNGIQNIYDRINDCFQRSLNGQPLDTTSKEMQAIYAYIKWLGEGVPKGTRYKGTSIMKLKLLSRAANPESGSIVYRAKCESCHGAGGIGQQNEQGTGFVYPPLWGNNSFNTGAGLFRIMNMAGFVKNNMPLGATYLAPQLTDEEAWDVAAYVNSMPRPDFDQSADWKIISKKPVDAPYGPYIDSFSQRQHKFGPYLPIEAAQAAVQK